MASLLLEILQILRPSAAHRVVVHCCSKKNFFQIFSTLHDDHKYDRLIHLRSLENDFLWFSTWIYFLIFVLLLVLLRRLLRSLRRLHHHHNPLLAQHLTSIVPQPPQNVHTSPSYPLAFVRWLNLLVGVHLKRDIHETRMSFDQKHFYYVLLPFGVHVPYDG